MYQHKVRIQGTSESVPDGHHKDIGISWMDLELELKYQSTHYNDNLKRINRTTHRTGRKSQWKDPLSFDRDKK